MLEIAGPLLEALDRGHRLAVATVTRVIGSAPRTLGTAMAVDDEGRVIGSISGGCVEGSVYDLARRVLDTGRSELVEFGVTDRDAFAVGLSCGGRLEVFVTELAPPGGRNAVTPAVRAELEAAGEGRAAGLALLVEGPGAGSILTLSDTPEAGSPLTVADGPDGHGHDWRRPEPRSTQPRPDDARRIRAELRARLAAAATASAVLDCDGRPTRVLFLVSAAPPRFLIFGAVDFAAALSDAAALLGYRVTVCDGRAMFATAARFPTAHEVVVEWPSDYLARTEVDDRTVVCVLTHDEKFDIPLLACALRRPVGFVGAMGSRRTHERRVASLAGAGLTVDDLERLHSPIGLDLGASTPAETAVSILAEVLAARTGASGAPLWQRSGPIHTPVQAPVHAPGRTPVRTPVR